MSLTNHYLKGAYYALVKARNEFNEKGTSAELLIADLCREAFFQDFCFKNPYYKKGKELCDVLVILDDTAIIWQIKNIKLGNDGFFSTSEVEKAAKQCRGAKRTLKAASVLTLTNVAGASKTIDTSKIKHVYLIAAIEGGSEEFSSYYEQDDSKGNVHIFFEKFTRFATTHLNTVSDFVKYLNDKESFLKDRSVIIDGGEENLLAVYLKQARTFGDSHISRAGHIYFDIENAADKLENDPDYQDKLEADRWSKGWDMLIEKKREGLAYEGSRDNAALRDEFLMKMMSHNRFERRYLSKTYFDAAAEAAKAPYNRTFMYRRYVPMNEHGVTYLFAFMGSADEPRGPRQAILSYAALATRARFKNNNMVIAIVSEQRMVKSKESGYDWVLLDMTDDEVAAELTPERIEVFGQLKFFSDPQFQVVSIYEYPSDVPKKKLIIE